jgi:RNA polymerase sigma-70 factor (ECF subfamily)
VTDAHARALAEQFEQHRAHLRAVAYRMLGSASEADDAVQESWIRLGRTDVSDVQNLRGWLTTVVARVCLDMLRTRASRREDPLDTHLPDPVITRADEDPESRAALADSVGLALLVVLEKLEPAERLALVLHDVFGMAFEEIAPIVDRSVVATRQLASRARRRVQGRRRPQTPTCGRSAASSTRFSRPSRTATSKRWSPCSIRISCCGPTAER